MMDRFFKWLYDISELESLPDNLRYLADEMDKPIEENEDE